MTARLNVNIDHVATVREARKTTEPNVINAAMICEQAGADGITVHLRQDRRHIQDRDLEQLKSVVTTYLNLEHAVTEEMIDIALRVKPDAVSLVPESPEEVTTEGGLNVKDNFDAVKNAIERLSAAGIFVSIFIDPDHDQIKAAADAGAGQIEICTAEYAFATLGSNAIHGEGRDKAAVELERIRSSAEFADNLGLVAAAGHGLTCKNVRALAAIPQIAEFNIGHHIISQAIFLGLERSVKEMIAAIESNN